MLRSIAGSLTPGGLRNPMQTASVNFLPQCCSVDAIKRLFLCGSHIVLPGSQRGFRMIDVLCTVRSVCWDQRSAL